MWSDDDAIGDAIDANDLDELVRIVDRSCNDHAWDALVSLRDRARRALERGRQMWPAASYAEYRLALDAPAEYAALALTDDAGRFALGPLAEVAASTHTWAELVPHLQPSPVTALVAHERVVRGEPVDANAVAHAEVLGVPLELARWEPEYLLPLYRPDRVEQPGPEPIRGRPLDLTARRGKRFFDREVVYAFRELVRPWTAASEGRANVVAVPGGAFAAIGALGVQEARGSWVDAAEALTWLAWAGSSGGRHGRRRGAAAGRDLAWAAVAACAGFEPGEQLEPATLGNAIAELRWLVWSAPDVSTGWVLRIAIEDPADGIAYACDAVDRS